MLHLSSQVQATHDGCPSMRFSVLNRGGCVLLIILMVAQESNLNGPSFSGPCAEPSLWRLRVSVDQLMSTSRSKECIYPYLVFFFCVCHSRQLSGREKQQDGHRPYFNSSKCHGEV